MTFLQRAIPLIDKGFSVIPLEPREKKPVAGMGVTRRSKDEAVVADWAEKYPDANVAVCADETFLVLDADDAVAMEEITGKLNTYTVQSSPGKAHYYFRQDPEWFQPARNLELGKLGSLRASNQYVVGAGSIHPKTGLEYAVVNDAPVAILHALVHHKLEQAALVAQRLVDSIDVSNFDTLQEPVPEGMRHYFLKRQCGILWDGEISEDDLIAKLVELNQRFCLPPKPDMNEITRLVHDAVTKWEPNRAGPKCVIGAPTPRKGYVLNPTVKGTQWFPLGQVGIVFGFSNAGKSTLTLQMLEAVADKVPFLEHTSAQRSILVVPLDRDMDEYYETLENMDIPRDRFLVDRPDRRALGEAVMNPRVSVPLISKLIEKHNRPEVVFLEGLDIFATDQTQKNIVPLMLDLQDVARHCGCALIGSWGCPKKQATRDGYQELRASASGSGMLGRMATTMIMIVKDRNVKGVRHVTVDHKRAEEETFIMKYSGARLKVVAAMDIAEEPKDLIELAVREGWSYPKYVAMAGEAAVSRATWKRRKGGSGGSPEVAQIAAHEPLVSHSNL